MSDSVTPFSFTHCRVCGCEVDEAHERLARRNIVNAICGSSCGAKEELARHACCEKAIQANCCCAYAITCPDHGERHFGTHD